MTTSLPPGRPPLRWPGGSPADTALVAVLMVGGVVGVAAELVASPDPNPPAIGGYAIAVLAAVPLLWRRQAPVPALAAVVACLLGYHLLGYPGFAPALCLFVAVYSAASYGPWIAAVAGTVAGYLIPLLPKYGVPWYSYSVTAPAVGIATMIVIGLAAKRRRMDAEQRVRLAAETATAHLQQRLAEERLTIARELHDVLAHTISVIAVQSASALDAIDTDVDAAKDAMRIVRAVARKAMPDLRGALAMLRATGNPELLAQPRLADLPDLVDSVRATGLAATLTVEPVRPDVTPFVELAAYRVVQEALTNVVRHASARSVAVTIGADGGELVVSIVDDGHGIGDRPGSGFGLLGMRERVALVAGTVQVGPGPAARGTAVVARLPLGSVTAIGG